MTKKIEVRLELYPNTGHHYYFIPLFIQKKGELEFEKVTSSGFEDISFPQIDDSLKQDIGNNMLGHIPWISGKDGFKWMRAVVSSVEVSALVKENPRKPKVDNNQTLPTKVIGIYVCVETNLGGADRGNNDSIVGPDGWEFEDEFSWIRHEADSYFPYVAKNEDELRTMALQPHSVSDIFPDLVSLIKTEDVPDNEKEKHKQEIFSTIYFIFDWKTHKSKPLPVQLIVDFGNSRTVALALELAPPSQGVARNKLSPICRPLLLNVNKFDSKRAAFHKGDMNDQVVDSWFIFREPDIRRQVTVRRNEKYESNEDDQSLEEPQFLLNKPIDKKRLLCKEYVSQKFNSLNWYLKKEEKEMLVNVKYNRPHMFCELSLAAMGEEIGHIFNQLDRRRSENYFISSPKRYAWDSVSKISWNMAKKSLRSENLYNLSELRGGMLAFITNEDEENQPNKERDYSVPEWKESSPCENGVDNKPYTDTYKHPRSDALIWTALHIIEKSFMQIQSEAFREGGLNEGRFLQDIVITYPSGWNEEEVTRYKQAWQYARNIFTWSRFDLPYELDRNVNGLGDGMKPPGVEMRMDESVASQLPIIFSEINHLRESYKRWLGLFGRQREGIQCCRVMTIDIGGGTIDTSVVEYVSPSKSSARGISLSPEVIFSDSSIHAGDKLIKSLIEGVLIPHLMRSIEGKNIRQKFVDIIIGGASKTSSICERALYVRTVFIPIIVYWLRGLASEGKSGSNSYISCIPGNVGSNRSHIAAFNSLFKEAGFGEVLSSSKELQVKYSEVEKIIHRWALAITELHSKFVAAYQCDLVIVTGKPSELNKVKEVIRSYLPIQNNRIIKLGKPPAMLGRLA